MGDKGGDDTAALLRQVLGGGDSAGDGPGGARRKAPKWVTAALIVGGIGIAAVIGYMLVKGKKKGNGNTQGNASESTGGAPALLASIDGVIEVSEGPEVTIPSPFKTKDEIRLIEMSNFTLNIKGNCNWHQGRVYGGEIAPDTMITSIYAPNNEDDAYATRPNDVTHADYERLRFMGGVTFSTSELHNYQLSKVWCLPSGITRTGGYEGCSSGSASVVPQFYYYSLSFDMENSKGKKELYERDNLGIVVLSDILLGRIKINGSVDTLAGIPLWYTSQGKPGKSGFVNCINCSANYVVPLNEYQAKYTRQNRCVRSKYTLGEEVSKETHPKFYWNYRLPRSGDITTKTKKVVVEKEGGVTLKEILTEARLPYRPDVISFIIAVNKYADRDVIMDNDEKSWLFKFPELPDGEKFWTTGKNTNMNHKSYMITAKKIDEENRWEYDVPLPFKDGYRLCKGDIIYIANMPEGYIHPDDAREIAKRDSEKEEL